MQSKQVRLRPLSRESRGQIMKTQRAIFLMSEQMGALAQSFARGAELDIVSTTVNCLKDIEMAFSKPCDLLLSIGSGVIVPQYILQSPGLTAVNIHAASPEFPGRDPHHFALYHGASRYGATLHYMIDKVDHGRIVDVELFDVPKGISAAELLAKADEAGIELMRRFFTAYAKSGAPVPRDDLAWTGRKSKRSDFVELCRIDCGMTDTEFHRRMSSTVMPGFNNLYIDIHGYRFRIDGKAK
jgi:methionyl-tRNA formyltransferase